MSYIKKLTFDDDSIISLKEEKYTRDWPVVYLLEDGNEAYVGETMSAISRFKQHIKNPERLKLNNAHIFIDDEYNKSAALDIESWLIQYLAADGQFRLQNANKGMVDHDYYDRDRYRSKFESLWEELKAEGLATASLLHLRNTDIFKYSPYKMLTQEQVSIANEISRNLVNGVQKTYIVNGSPGTGKSVLAVYLSKLLTELEDRPNLKVALVIPMVSLRDTLKKVFRKVKGLDASMVIAPNHVMGNHYDLLIVDEAHRLRQRKNLTGYAPFDTANNFYELGKEGTQLDWVLLASDSQILMFDENQSVTPGDIPISKILNLNAEKFYLSNQMRVEGGDDYIQFIDSLLNSVDPLNGYFLNYDLRLFNSINDLIDEIKLRDSEHGLSRVVAGYAWDWRTKKGIEAYDIEIDGLKLVWNSTNTDWVNSRNAINEVGCIHTVQGYDLNYVGVILGPEIDYDFIKNRIIIDKAKYKDISGKRSLNSDDDLAVYIKNIYKTLLTRGIKGTYIFACNKNMQEYLNKYIEK